MARTTALLLMTLLVAGCAETGFVMVDPVAVPDATVTMPPRPIQPAQPGTPRPAAPQTATTVPSGLLPYRPTPTGPDRSLTEPIPPPAVNNDQYTRGPARPLPEPTLSYTHQVINGKLVTCVRHGIVTTCN
jgi:hypothetical protein